MRFPKKNPAEAGRVKQLALGCCEVYTVFEWHGKTPANIEENDLIKNFLLPALRRF